MATIFLSSLGAPEIILIVLAILILFGASAIPRFAKSLGKAKAEFEKGLKEGEKEADEPEKKEESGEKGKSE
ncbi:MAG: twin-arginine translocase TatA/TatE family subunit [Spirochaetales bacterium]|nr:twin-arginine translocase TatA/TatE family subunit [Spirochaetales bacterium]